MDILDLLPLVNTDRKVSVLVAYDTWLDGKVYGIDLVHSQALVALDHHNGDLFFAKWYPLYFRLNDKHEKHFKIKII